MGIFASQSPGFHDDPLLIDFAPGRVRLRSRTWLRSAPDPPCEVRAIPATVAEL
jgi:hypothetical protein